MHLYLFSCFFLAVVGILCAVGLMSHTYKENLFQNLGMSLLMIGCASRVKDIWINEAVAVDWFIIHAGMFLFALGVFVKVFFRAFHDRILAFQTALLGVQSLPPQTDVAGLPLWAETHRMDRRRH